MNPRQDILPGTKGCSDLKPFKSSKKDSSTGPIRYSLQSGKLPADIGESLQDEVGGLLPVYQSPYVEDRFFLALKGFRKGDNPRISTPLGKYLRRSLAFLKTGKEPLINAYTSRVSTVVMSSGPDRRGYISEGNLPSYRWDGLLWTLLCSYPASGKIRPWSLPSCRPTPSVSTRC